jgi:SAM-dependent methyltransferase
MSQNPTDATDVKTTVRNRYGQIAESVLANQTASCCGPVPVQFVDGAFDTTIPLQAASSCCSPGGQAAAGPAYADLLYNPDDLAGLPESVITASLGCGNPTAIAALLPGQAVLDLGSGGGIDCFLAARQVGPNGQVIGLDMTPAMLELAERNRQALGADNVRFVRGEIESIPLPDADVDVIISNCVINLSPDKDAVFGEAFRVLRPGGYLAVSDVVALQPLSEAMVRDLAAWSACVAGALDGATYRKKLHAAGFERVEITDVIPTDFGIEAGIEDGAASVAEGISGGLKSLIASAKIVAYKPT